MMALTTRFHEARRGAAALIALAVAAACSSDGAPTSSNTGGSGGNGGTASAGGPTAGGGGSNNMAGGGSNGMAGGGANGMAGGGAGGGANGMAGGGAGQAGQMGSGGEAGGGAGGEAGSAAGNDIEFRACEAGAAVQLVTLTRIDRSSSTCISITMRQSMAGCTLGLAGNDGWCLARAVVSQDVAACEAQQAPGDAIDAEAATGTFSVELPSPIQMDVVLEFPSGTDFPEMQRVQMTGCAADCQPNDCRE